MTHAYGGIYFPTRLDLVAYAMCGHEDRRGERPWSMDPDCAACRRALGLSPVESHQVTRAPTPADQAGAVKS